MTEFRFEGKIPLSKSLVIRNLVCQSYAGNFINEMPGAGEDVRKVIKGLKAIGDKASFDCGDGAAVLRFLALRASREVGSFEITGTRSLFARPHEELIRILKVLGVESKSNEQSLTIVSQSWPKHKIFLSVDRSFSSQFASGLVLNSWGLEMPLEINWTGSVVSDGYLEMTLQLVEALGMKIRRGNGNLQILPSQKPVGNALLEPDMSSAFSIAALAAIGGACQILDFPQESIQPDRAFMEVLDAMGAKVRLHNECLYVNRAQTLLPIGVNLKDSPDLFPVLAVLCAFAKGKSKLFGAPHLKHKESDRLQSVCTLLDLIGREYEPSLDGLVIYGRPFDLERENRFPINYNSQNDHRLVMAAAVARQAGFNIHINNVKAVDKSFPQFKEITNLC